MSDFLRRLEDELVRAGYDPRPAARARRSRLRAVAATAGSALVVLLTLATVAVLSSDDTQRQATPSKGVAIRVTPSEGGRHTRFHVTITTDRATGVVGKTERSYFAQLASDVPASACVNGRDGYFGARPAGVRTTATIDPRRGEGGELGWCRGTYHGVVRFIEAPACPPEAHCVPPAPAKARTEVVARFTVRVR